MKKNDQIAIGVVAGKELTGSKEEARALNHTTPTPKTPEERLGLAAQVAESTTYCRNWKFKNADKHFPHDPLMRRVEKHFPYAKGGPLLVDEPVSALEVAECKRKAQIMKKEGLRYCYIEKDMSLHHVLAQLSDQKKESA